MADLAQGVANRDLKLENLLLDRDGSDGTRPLLKICDFGYSKVRRCVASAVVDASERFRDGSAMDRGRPPWWSTTTILALCPDCLRGHLRCAALRKARAAFICPVSSAQHEQNSSAKTGVGTPIYMAPEIIYGGNRYDAKVPVCLIL